MTTARCTLCPDPATAFRVPYGDQVGLQQMVDHLVTAHGFDRDQLETAVLRPVSEEQQEAVRGVWRRAQQARAEVSDDPR